MTVTRVTDAAALQVGWCNSRYSTMRSGNCDNSKILLLRPTCFDLYDGVTLKLIKSLQAIGDSNEPLWSRTDPDKFYYHIGNKICLYSLKEGIGTVIKVFPEYAAINFGNGETDLSFDNDHLPILGDGRELSLYQISTDTKSPILAVGPGLDSAIVTPDNNVLTSTAAGMALYDRNMKSVRMVANANGHKALTRDADGAEVLLWINSNENPVTLPAFPNGIVKIKLSDASQVGLVSLPWSFAVHITADPNGMVLFETYPGAGAIYQLPLTGFPVHLCDHGSSAKTYESQPRVSISQDGSRAFFNSDLNGLPDVYQVTLSSPPPPPPGPIDSQIVYLDARGGGKMSVATFKAGLLVENVNLP